MAANADSLEAILGINETKLGFFQEWQIKLRELHEAHAESERRRLSLAAILEGITDLMMVLDKDLRILSANRVFEEMFPGGSYIGEHCYTLFCDSSRPCPKCPAFRSLRHNTVNRESEIFHIGGRNLHFDMVASPLPHPSGHGQAVLMLKRDVTLEKQLQAQIYQAEKMASIGTLAAGVAHEINNPLTAIVGFAEGISRRIPRLRDCGMPDITDDLSEYANTILRECGRCKDIVQALMNFSRPLSKYTPVSLCDLIEETLPLLQHVLKRHASAVICLDLDRSMPSIHADDTQIRQVLLNLVTNALDALGPAGSTRNGPADGGKITIRGFRDGDNAVLEVEDTGGGIAPHHLRSAFEPFFTTKPKGLGLGLSICYTIIKAHGGEIFLTCSNDEKTIATVLLPVTRREGGICAT